MDGEAETNEDVDAGSYRTNDKCCPKLACLERFIQSKAFYIYFCHGLSAWGDRMWAFAVGLYLVEINSNTLQLTATYGLIKGCSVLLFGAIVGDWVDRTQRLRAARTSLIINNLLIIFCAVMIIVLFYNENFIRKYENGILFTLTIVLIISLAVGAHLASVGNKIIIQRDWIVVICGSDSDKLTNMSANLRRIDLVTNTLAPLTVGQIMTFGSPIIGAIFIACWNMMSMLTEYYLFFKVYKRVPELAHKEGQHHEGRRKSKTIPRKVFANFITLYQSWSLYMKQPVVFAGLSFSCLYLSVFGFDNVTVGYIYSQGLTESLVGITTGLGAFFGVCGTILFQFLKRKLGLPKTGLFAVIYYNTIVISCLISVWLPGSPFLKKFDKNSVNNASLLHVHLNDTNSTRTYSSNDKPDSHPSLPKSLVSLICVLVGMVIGRLGMWMSDLGITQQFLESVDEANRGKVNGVQTSLNMLMDMIKFGLAIALPNPKSFGILIIISFFFVSLASILNIFHVYKIKTQEVHSDDGAPNDEKEENDESKTLTIL